MSHTQTPDQVTDMHRDAHHCLARVALDYNTRAGGGQASFFRSQSVSPPEYVNRMETAIGASPLRGRASPSKNKLTGEPQGVRRCNRW